MRVVVTGGAGFIGSHLVDALIQLEHQVLVVDDLSCGRKENINAQAQFAQVDVASSALNKVIADFQPQIIYHLAAQKNVRTSLAQPSFDARVNILGSLNVLEQALANKVERFIFVSTGGIYGNAKILPTPETETLTALSPYILAKLTFERYLAMLAQDKMKYIILRPANVYGPRQDPGGEAGVISIFIDKFLKNQPLIVNGDGRQTRDYLYVADLVVAMLKSVEARSGIYNISTATETSLLDLISQLQAISGSTVAITHNPAIAGEVVYSALAYDQAKNELGWQPQYSLSQGLKLTYQYFDQTR